MNRYKLAVSAAFATLAATFATLALSGVSTASASTGWVVEGTKLSGSAALASTATVTTDPKLTSAGVTIECTGTTLGDTSGEIVSPSKLNASSLAFNGCKSVSENCTEPASTISTLPVLAGEFAEEGNLTDDTLVLLPKTKTTFATIKYEGEKCALAGVQPLTGKIGAKLWGMEGTAELLVLLPSAGQLKVGSSAAELIAGAEFELAAKKAFDWLSPELLLAFKAGRPFLNLVNKRLELKFTANQKIEFLIGNISNAAYTLEKRSIEPNENDFKLEAPVGVECKNNQELKTEPANACNIAIKNVNEADATIKVEYNNKEVVEGPIFR